MNPKPLTVFAAVAAVVVIAAGVSIGARYSGGSTVTPDERMFPTVAGKIADIAEVSVQTAKETLTAKRDGEKWSMVERQGYAVSEDVVRKVIVGMSELRKAEAKTEKADLYTRLNVENVTKKDAKSKLLRLKDKSGKVVAEAIVGKFNGSLAGPTGVGIYVRVPGASQSWLAQGTLDVPDEAKKWMPREIMNVAVKRVREVSVVQPDGAKMVIEKAAEGKGKYKIRDLPASRKIKYDSDVQNVGEGLDDLELEDVRATGKVTFPADKVVKSEYRTFDGLKIDVESFEDKEGNFWGRFTASAPGGGDKIAQEAAQINAKVSPWIFSLPAYKYRYMSRALKDVLEDEKTAKKK